MNKRIIIGITGASGAIYGIRMLEILQNTDIETHLIISKAARITIPHETEYRVKDVEELADKSYAFGDIAADISSGSYKTLGMVIAPCTVKTLSEIATGIGGNLMTRAADVVLKERRRLVLMVRETPLHTVHLRNMTTLSELGAIIAPPVATFYNNPKTIEDQVQHSVGRVLDLFDLDIEDIVNRWGESK